MPNYVRFSDNTTNSTNSYKLFDDNHQQNQELDPYKQSPQQLQRQQEQFQQQTSHQQQNRSQPHQIHSQSPLPNFDEETRNKQLELRQKRQQLQQERYQSSIPHSQVEQQFDQPPPPQQQFDQPPPPQPMIENFSMMSVSDIRQRFPNTNDIYINEIHRLLQAENTLTLEQASNLAKINGCGMDGYTDMCPSKPVENFQQNGNCVGEGCDVTFSSEKVVEKYEKSMADKLSELDITFHTNDGCHFCQQTMSLFESEGVMGSVNVSKSLPSGARGFPHFVSATTGKTHTGFPRSVDRLYDLLS